MKLRIITGLTAAALLITLVYLGEPWMILLAVLLASIGAYLEFDRLFFPTSRFRQMAMPALVVAMVLAFHLNPLGGWLAMWIGFVLISIVHVHHSNTTGDFFAETRAMSLELLSLLYVVSLFAFLAPIAEMTHGRHLLMLLFILVFSGDTAAYFVGIKLGKHRLATRLSPKKSIEGAIAGGVVSTIATSAFACWAFHDVAQDGFFLKVLIFAPIGSILAQLGDLFESMLKRSQAQKDSGSFLPGHGGLLDRVDGLALVSPIYYVYLLFVLERA
jgi:phosphatidate cytidylyltransferase